MKLFNLLGDDGIFGPNVLETFNKIRLIIGDVFTAIIVIAALCMLIYAIYIAFKLAKAEDDGKRKEAKNHLMWAIIGLVAALALVGLFKLVLADPKIDYKEVKFSNSQVSSVVSLVESIIGSIFGLAGIAAAVFAGYIAYRLMTASDDGKRKQAKQQLIWTLIAIVGIYALQGLIQTVLTALLKEAVISSTSTTTMIDLFSGFLARIGL